MVNSGANGKLYDWIPAALEDHFSDREAGHRFISDIMVFGEAYCGEKAFLKEGISGVRGYLEEDGKIRIITER